MNTEEITKRVTAKLAGEFYIGQRVKYIGLPNSGAFGTIVEFTHEGRAAHVDWDRPGEAPQGVYLWALRAA